MTDHELVIHVAQAGPDKVRHEAGKDMEPVHSQQGERAITCKRKGTDRMEVWS